MTTYHTLLSYADDQPPRVILEFVEAIDSNELQYLSCDLQSYLGFDDHHRMDDAINRAIRACQALSIPSRKHFRKVFLIRETGIIRGWRLSQLGCYLTILNEDPSHPLIAKIQTKYLSLRLYS